MDPRICGLSIHSLSYPQFTTAPRKFGKLNKCFINFKTRAKQELAVTWWNPAAQTRPVLDSSSVAPVPMLPCKLATILLLAFLLLESVAALSQCLCSESKKKNGEVGEYPRYAKVFLTNKIFLLQVMYRYVPRTYDFHCKIWNNNMFFHCLCSALMKKRDFYCSVIPWNCALYCTVQVLYFFIALLSLED